MPLKCLFFLRIDDCILCTTSTWNCCATLETAYCFRGCSQFRHFTCDPCCFFRKNMMGLCYWHGNSAQKSCTNLSVAVYFNWISRKPTENRCLLIFLYFNTTFSPEMTNQTDVHSENVRFCVLELQMSQFSCDFRHTGIRQFVQTTTFKWCSKCFCTCSHAPFDFLLSIFLRSNSIQYLLRTICLTFSSLFITDHWSIFWHLCISFFFSTSSPSSCIN